MVRKRAIDKTEEANKGAFTPRALMRKPLIAGPIIAMPQERLNFRRFLLVSSPLILVSSASRDGQNSAMENASKALKGMRAYEFLARRYKRQETP